MLDGSNATGHSSEPEGATLSSAGIIAAVEELEKKLPAITLRK